MANENLVGRCGLHCETCSICRTYKDDRAYLRLLAKHFKCPREKVRCKLLITTEQSFLGKMDQIEIENSVCSIVDSTLQLP
ncbi:MAG: hypothetical protein WBV70_06010 [Candidatus Bathyarchaeia archaeon]